MEKLRELIVLTQGAAWWAFIFCCFTISAAVVSIIILLVNRHPTATFVIGIIVSSPVVSKIEDYDVLVVNRKFC